MTIEHYDALPQGLTRWQLTICLTLIAAAYMCVAYLDQQEARRAECMQKGLLYSDSLDQCLKEPLNHATP